MNKEVIIWTEGGSGLGMGHIVRSVNLAVSLKKEGLSPSFMVNHDKEAENRLRAAGFPYKTVSFETGPVDIIDAEIIVIDTKKDAIDLVNALRAKRILVVLIDNLTKASKLADMIVMPTALPVYFREEADNFFSGAEYLFIGENFKKARGAVGAVGGGGGGTKVSHSLPLKILVTMGASDPMGITSLVADALRGIEGIEVTIVIGGSFAEPDPEVYSAGCEHIKCLSGLTDLAPLMKEAHLGITANGTSIYEMAFMGLPSLVTCNFETDLKDLEGYEALGISKSLGFFCELTPETIRASIEPFFDSDTWQGYSTRAISLTDGRGADRAALLIASLMEKRAETKTKVLL